MILHTTRVEQTIDGDWRGQFIKELVLVRVPVADHDFTKSEGVPLALLRKRSAEVREPIATVVLLHGYGQNRYAWHLPSRSVSCYLADAGFDVFSLELRGHGRSRHLGAHPPADVRHYVDEDVPAAIDEIQKLTDGRPVFMVGHSLGGLISYAAAPLLPGRIAGVVTLGSPYRFTKGSTILGLVGSSMLALDKRISLGHGALELKPLAELLRVTRGLIETVPLPIRGFAPGSMEPQVINQHMALAMDSGSIAVMRNMFLSAARSRQSGRRLGGMDEYADAFEAAEDLPLLIIAGAKDDLAPPASVEPGYQASRSNDKTYRVFPQGHIDLLVGRDCPQTIWPLVDSWIRTRARRLAESA